MIASRQGHIHVVSILVDNGAHVNLQNKVPTKQKSSKWYMHACTYNGAVIVILFHHAEGWLSPDDCLQ